MIPSIRAAAVPDAAVTRRASFLQDKKTLNAVRGDTLLPYGRCRWDRVGWLSTDLHPW